MENKGGFGPGEVEKMDATPVKTEVCLVLVYNKKCLAWNGGFRNQREQLCSAVDGFILSILLVVRRGANACGATSIHWDFNAYFQEIQSEQQQEHQLCRVSIGYHDNEQSTLRTRLLAV